EQNAIGVEVILWRWCSLKKRWWPPLPVIAKAQGKRHYCAAAYSKKPGSRRNDQIGSRKGGSHARDEDRYSRFNFTQHCRYGPGPGSAVSEPDDASTGIGRHDNSAGSRWPYSCDGACTAALHS